MIKGPEQIRYIRTHLDIINVYIYDQLITILDKEKLKAFPLRSGTREGCLLSQLLFNIWLKVLATEIRQEKEIKSIQMGKEEVNLYQFVDNIILYSEKPKDSSKRLLKLINNFSKIPGYKNQSLFYTSIMNSLRKKS